MTVKELIRVLKRFPQDQQVLVDGYEAGYDDIISVDNRKVVRDDTAPEYEGRYHKVDEDETGETVLVIKR